MRRCSSSQVIIAGERVESSEAVSSPLPFSGPFNDIPSEFLEVRSLLEFLKDSQRLGVFIDQYVGGPDLRDYLRHLGDDRLCPLIRVGATRDKGVEKAINIWGVFVVRRRFCG